jgi:hypothetical protein
MRGRNAAASGPSASAVMRSLNSALPSGLRREQRELGLVHRRRHRRVA